MDDDVLVRKHDWKNTKEAVRNFRRLLLCSKCSNVMTEPVCLGVCEHLLCRSCAAPRAGDGCVVCQSPAWVKDIQINRQLSSVIQLFCGLEFLLNPAEQADSSLAQNQTPPQSPVLKQKKNFKIWFSPRSRKVRCVVEKQDPVPESPPPRETTAAQQDTSTAQCQDLSVFNFTSSSQDSGSSGSPRSRNGKGPTKRNAVQGKGSARGATRTTRKKTKQKQKQKQHRLEAINQQWGISGEADAIKEKEQKPCAKEPSRSSKRVSFLSPAVTPDEPQPKVPHGVPNELAPGSSLLEGAITVLGAQTQPGQRTSDSVGRHDTRPETTIPERQVDVSPSKPSSKRSRVEERVATLETTPKRPRASPGRRRRSPASPAAHNALSSDGRRCGDSPSHPAAAGEQSPCTPVASGGRPTSGSPAFMKRNHKGETPLHLAAIKGDVEAVNALLDQGADPNLKDNAGWTPLHEACNLGHLVVVEVLVSRGALLNTPGYENDSPLHDAVRNGHPAIVKLLLRLGASRHVLNQHGKRPADYAGSPEMLEIFLEAPEESQNANTSPSPSTGLSMRSNCVGRDELVVLLTSRLSQPERARVAKLGELLGGRTADTFSGLVSHVVVPVGHLPTTSSTLLGLLAGCWVLKFSWVEACLQAGEWTPEAEHEAGEGAQRSRINRRSLLPPLFDGCFFFLLGPFKAISKEELAKLLREGGGQLLSRQPKPDSDVTQTLSAAAYHALPGTDQALCTQYIIYDPQGPHKPAVVRRGKVWSAPCTWLLNCIAAFRLLPVTDSQTPV
ncbi:BRCA1-associated RING domain protein 1 [Pungitius pungitius]|uniref:BRCA1-associated RING domain protein 1 n=1 Tax=Pungitius pungitius TaxID=134920 RepID=UPI002E131240